MQHNGIPSNPILYGGVSGLLTFPVNYNDAGILTGVRKCRIQASVTKPVLLTFFANITTAFNASTTNILTVGSDYVSADQFLAAADITEGTVGFYPASNASKKYWLTADTDLIIRYNGGAQATGTLTSDNTIPTAGDTVTIADPVSGITEVYTFRASPTVEGDVHVVTDADTSLLNLIRAINHSGTAGTDYVKAAASVLVTAAASVTSHAFAVTAIKGGVGGNSITTTETSSHLSWGAATLGSGTSGSPSAGAGNIFLNVSQIDPKNSSNLGVN